MADRGHDPRAFRKKGSASGPDEGAQGQPVPIPGMEHIPGMPVPRKSGDDEPRKERSGRSRPAPPRPNDSLDEAVRRQIRAYPGTITYLDLIRRNKRASAILIACMILLAVVVGVAIGAASSLYVAPPGSALDSPLSPMVLGALVGGLLGLVISGAGAVWAFNAGANAILRMSHARPITKEMDPELVNIVEELAIAAGIPVPKIYVIGDSAMNAFATGKDPEHAAVAITVGLRQKLTRDELQGVMAHEIAHIRHYDIRFSLLMAVMVGLIATATDAFLRVTWHAGHRTRRSSRESGGAQIVVLLIAIVLAVLAPLIATIIQMAYSRQREYLADAGAVELTRYPKGLADALRKLAADDDPLVDTANRGTAHMYIVNPLNKMRRNPHEVSSPFSSHPPIAKRIARLEALMR